MCPNIPYLSMSMDLVEETLFFTPLMMQKWQLFCVQYTIPNAFVEVTTYKTSHTSCILYLYLKPCILVYKSDWFPSWSDDYLEFPSIEWYLFSITKISHGQDINPVVNKWNNFTLTCIQFPGILLVALRAKVTWGGKDKHIQNTDMEKSHLKNFNPKHVPIIQRTHILHLMPLRSWKPYLSKTVFFCIIM